jgi:selenocysteine lyase/cysteine desulfurase
LDRIPTHRLHTADQVAPFCIETGTLNHAAIAGLPAAVHFIADIDKGNDLRKSIVSSYEKLGAHERQLAMRLAEGLQQIPGIRLVGQDFSSAHRAPTVSFAWEGRTPTQVCAHLAKTNICAWDGHFYARRAIEVLGLLEKGGVTRLGISVYNTTEEIDFVLSELQRFSSK